MSSSYQPPPQGLQQLTEHLSDTFKAKYKEYKSKMLPYPSTYRYLSTHCFKLSDKFRDDVMMQYEPEQFTFSHIGDELLPKNDNTHTGHKREGIKLDGPLHKKRKLNNDENTSNAKEENDDIKESDDDDDDDDDMDMFDNTNKKRKPAKRKKLRLPEKYRDDEDLQSLEAPSAEPSKADEFFDPINFCRINLEKESRINVNIKNFGVFDGMDNDIKNEEIQYIKKNELYKYLSDRAIKHGLNVKHEILTMVCLGIQEHLKNMFDEMDKWRRKRMDEMDETRIGLEGIKYDAINKQQWIDHMNGKYIPKQQIMDKNKDEKQLLETDKFYVIDVINMIQNNRKYDKEYTRLLSKLYATFNKLNYLNQLTILDQHKLSQCKDKSMLF